VDIDARIEAVAEPSAPAAGDRQVFVDRVVGRPPSVRLPLALADLHRATAVHAPVRLRVGGGWQREALERVVEGAGFAIDGYSFAVAGGRPVIDIDATRLPTLPDTVGPEMRVLLVGLNPSPYSAEMGVGFARPGNRFWPAALASGLVGRDRDTRDALVAHGVGMTDLVKRATARAADLAPDEYRAGARRVEALVAWLGPEAVCFVGLSGYRVAIAPAAGAGWQPARFGGRPAYVMPNPSGLNARATPAVLAAHFRALQERPLLLGGG
jgi:TDG/mug DNA glycosylase family protein